MVTYLIELKISLQRHLTQFVRSVDVIANYMTIKNVKVILIYSYFLLHHSNNNNEKLINPVKQTM